jgi:hypothetical protein
MPPKPPKAGILLPLPVARAWRPARTGAISPRTAGYTQTEWPQIALRPTGQNMLVRAECFTPAAAPAFSTEAGIYSAPGNYGAAASQDYKVVNAETTASHSTAVMKVATIQSGPRRR